jgi:hypothetical protein
VRERPIQGSTVRARLSSRNDRYWGAGVMERWSVARPHRYAKRCGRVLRSLHSRHRVAWERSAFYCTVSGYLTVTHETLDQIKPVSGSRNNWPFAATQRVALKMDRRLSGNCRIGRVSIQICSLLASGGRRRNRVRRHWQPFFAQRFPQPCRQARDFPRARHRCPGQDFPGS